MPISIDEFESDAADLGDETNADRILAVLTEHPEQAFTRSEIAARTGVNPNSVGPVLSRLKEQELVRHRGRYWAIAGSGTQNEEGPGSSGDSKPESPEGSQAPSDQHRRAAAAFAREVRAHLPDDVEALYLFGSVARDSESATSDVDVLAVIADDAEGSAVDDRLLDIAFETGLEHDVSIEVHPLARTEFENRRDRGEPFVETVLREGERYV